MRFAFEAPWLLSLCVVLCVSTVHAEPDPLPPEGKSGASIEAKRRAAQPANADESEAYDDEYKFKLSLPTVEDHEAWRRPGFRLQIGYSYGQIMGIDNNLPETVTHAIVVRAGLKLDASWSLMGTLRYALVLDDIKGIWFSGTLDPTWHITDNLRLALGVGFAGFFEPVLAREQPSGELRDELVAPYTFPNTDQLIPQCSGTGVMALTRLEYWLVIGPLASTGPMVQADVQWVGCEEDLNRVEPDTAEPIVRRQWWAHAAFTAGWMVAWR